MDVSKPSSTLSMEGKVGENIKRSHAAYFLWFAHFLKRACGKHGHKDAKNLQKMLDKGYPSKGIFSEYV